MVSVADVRTAVAVSNSRPRSSPATDSGATRNTGLSAPRVSSWSSHTTSVRSGIAGTNESRTRAAVSAISVSAAIASVRAAAALGSRGEGSMSARAELAASRRAVR